MMVVAEYSVNLIVLLVKFKILYFNNFPLNLPSSKYIYIYIGMCSKGLTQAWFFQTLYIPKMLRTTSWLAPGRWSLNPGNILPNQSISIYLSLGPYQILSANNVIYGECPFLFACTVWPLGESGDWIAKVSHGNAPWLYVRPSILTLATKIQCASRLATLVVICHYLER